MKLFDGNYSRFLHLQKEYEENLINEAKKQQKEEEKLRAIIVKYATSSGKRKRMAQDREKKLERLLSNKIDVLEDNKKIDLKMQVDQELNNMPISVEKLFFKYNDSGPYIINDLSFAIYKGEKFLILGKNGVGKSTLLKLLNNILVPESGIINIGSKVKIGYYAQEFENLDNDLSIIENFGNSFTPSKIRSVLAKFLFTGDDIYKKVGVLSPGERARVALAKLSMSGANLLLLDEPTNHLDPETQNIIGEVFNSFEGSMIVVSHNIEFVKKIGIERILVLPNGKIEYYNDDIVKYYHD
jgi:ATP-binding cassette subfamily F protein 3